MLRCTECGKPFLESDYGLEFSISHSGRLLHLGVSKETVGVDIEGIRSMPELEAVGRLAFTPGEMAVVEDDPRGSRSKAFFRLWTGKEALLKGLGVGFLSDPLEVELRPAPFGFRAKPRASRTAEWSVASLRVASASGQRLGFAAVALPVHAETFRVYAFAGPGRGSRGGGRGDASEDSRGCASG